MAILTKRFLELSDGLEVELRFVPVNESKILKECINGQWVIGYLAEDSDAGNPLDEQDGIGAIYSSHRHAGREQHEAMQEALGLDSDWSPDLQGIWNKHTEAVLSRYVERVLSLHDLAELVAEFAENYERDAGESDEAFARDCLNKDADVSYIDNVPFWEELEAVLQEMFEDPAFSPRNPDAVVLDVYDHSGQVWSLSGQGMQCQWDTARGGGVWVPDECAREKIDRRAPIYAHYWIENTNWLQCTGKKYLLHGPDDFSQFSSDWPSLWGQATMLAKDMPDPTPAQLTTGRERAARELAKNALDEYNAWLSGECYGIVIQVHDKENAALISSDDCWNFIGSEYAQEALQDEFDSTLKQIQEAKENDHVSL